MDWLNRHPRCLNCSSNENMVSGANLHFHVCLEHAALGDDNVERWCPKCAWIHGISSLSRALNQGSTFFATAGVRITKTLMTLLWWTFDVAFLMCRVCSLVMIFNILSLLMFQLFH